MTIGWAVVNSEGIRGLEKQDMNSELGRTLLQLERDAMPTEDTNVNDYSNGKGSLKAACEPCAAATPQDVTQPESPRPAIAAGEGSGAGVESSPPSRKDTMSSTSTVISATNQGPQIDATITNVDAEPPVSPSQGQSIFSVKDGANFSNNRRATRRRTGPLSQQQREKAALIRKLGACTDCRRRRVAVSTVRCSLLDLMPHFDAHRSLYSFSTLELSSATQTTIT